MRCVQLGWRVGEAAALRPVWQSASVATIPALPGMLARQWHLEGDSLHGWYVFDEGSEAVNEFVAHPEVDPAYRALAAHIGRATPKAPEITTLSAARRIDRPVFVIAAPRAGSTLLFDLLAKAPGVWTQDGAGSGVVDGIADLQLAMRGYASDRLTDEHVTARVLPCLQAAWSFGLRDRLGRPHDTRDGPPRLLDKTTEHSLRVAFLARACPDARFVFLHRDARQSVSSLVHAWRHGGFVRFRDLPGWPPRQWCFLLPPDWRALRGASLQAIATAQWDAANRYALDDCETLEAARWTSVDYNELVAHPRAVVTRLCKALDIEIDAEFDAHLGRPLPTSATTITPPSPIKWRSHQGLDVAALEAATRVTSARLRSIRVASGSAAAASRFTAEDSTSTARFACYLDDVATRGDDAEESDGALIVEPGFRFQIGASVPLGLAGTTRFRDRFLADQPILWTRDMLTEAYRPYWLSRRHAMLLTRFEPGAPPPPCPEPLEAQLRAAAIILSAGTRVKTRQAASAMRIRLADSFNKLGHCVVPGVLSDTHAAALARYYRELIASGSWALGDAQVARRHGWHNESVARFFHHQLTAFVAAIVGSPVCASYAYVSAYQQGAELEPHVDRKQCEYTFSIVFDEVGGRSLDWPLWFLAGSEPSSVSLDIGTGVLFRGHDLPHWREAAARPGLALSTLLLHYVPSDFKETLH